MLKKIIFLTAFLFCCPLDLRAIQARAIGEKYLSDDLKGTEVFLSLGFLLAF